MYKHIDNRGECLVPQAHTNGGHQIFTFLILLDENWCVIEVLICIALISGSEWSEKPSNQNRHCKSRN